jgi:hypothetical protein
MIHSLFAAPIYISKAIVSAEDKQSILSLSYTRNELDNGNMCLFGDYAQYRSLKRLIDYNVKQYIQQLIDQPKTFIVSHIWAMQHNKGDFAQKHNHTTRDRAAHSNPTTVPDISGVIMLDGIDKTSGNLTVHRSDTDPFNNALGDDSSITAQSWMWIPEPNQIFLFPASLDHSVTANLNDSIRTTIAFDVIVNK